MTATCYCGKQFQPQNWSHKHCCRRHAVFAQKCKIGIKELFRLTDKEKKLYDRYMQSVAEDKR